MQEVFVQKMIGSAGVCAAKFVRRTSDRFVLQQQWSLLIVAHDCESENSVRSDMIDSHHSLFLVVIALAATEHGHFFR